MGPTPINATMNFKRGKPKRIRSLFSKPWKAIGNSKKMADRKQKEKDLALEEAWELTKKVNKAAEWSNR